MGASEGVYATTAHSVVLPRSQQQLLGHGKIRYAMIARWIPGNSDCVPPAGWAEAGGANQPHRMSVMSFLAGCVRPPRGDGWKSVGGGAGVRRAAVGAAAGALATRCWLSGTPWKLERAPA